jgi:outer membrane protein assembly factor BamB
MRTLFHGRRLLWTTHVALGAALAALAGLCTVAAQAPTPATAPKPADKPAGPKIVVKLVSDFESAKPVSDFEEFRPVTTTMFTNGGSREVTLGERCTLWVRNAHVDGKFFFERYYQEKYVGRNATLEIDVKELGAGQHVVEPGHHAFTLAADNALSSDDPNIKVQGRTLMLKMHKVTVYGVDGGKTGPADFRLQPADFGVLRLDPGYKMDAAKLPDPRHTLDPRQPKPAGKDGQLPPLTNVLSHQKPFYPLSVWLPANTAGQGYVLYPSWQTFHVAGDGQVVLGGGGAPKVAGVEAEGSTILVPQRQFAGKVQSRSGLTAGVGATPLGLKMNFAATLAPVQFLTGLGDPRNDPPAVALAVGAIGAIDPMATVARVITGRSKSVSLPVDNDLTRSPHKFFLADNATPDAWAVRALALEWQKPIFARGAEARVALRFLENSAPPTVKKPEARVSWSVYNPSLPTYRVWKPLTVLGWTNGREAGELRFRAPDEPFRFVVLRVQVVDADNPTVETGLMGEIEGCVIDPRQTGSVSVVSNKGRNAFVAGEDIDLSLVFRSQKPRAAGQRTLTLSHPDGRAETLPVPDSGEAWFAQELRLPAARTQYLEPGQYTLGVRDLPDDIVSIPFVFDLAGRQKPSLFHIVKPSKYTEAMNSLEPSHLQGRPVDLDRVVRTFDDLGYTRVDLMSYMTNHHERAYTWREELADEDPRLPAPQAVFTPTPRDQIMNACVRHGLQYADIWLSYGDFALPRYIDPYIRASERWMAREVQAQRHSPAWDGLILYDEMYQNAAVGFVKEHNVYFNKERIRRAEKDLGQPPTKIEEAFSRYLSRPRNQRDPKALDSFLKYVEWQAHGWSDYINRVVAVGRELSPRARFGTYHRTWLGHGTNDDIYNGYPPDIFKNLDIIGHIHYADNSTAWVSIPLLAQALRTGQGKTLYVNMPLAHESRTQSDGQYQRHMAFALLAQGANGISQWGLPTSFVDAANPETAHNRDTTAPLNRDVLRPFGEIIDRTRDGYRKVGIVSLFNEHALSANKVPPTSNQTEGIWIACWRLGYPAVFVREEHLQEKLDGFSVLFVPGVRYDGELGDLALKRLREAIAQGTKVVVEADSILDLPGVIRLNDWSPNSYFLGDTYFPTWLDDELNKVYEKSQPIVDYLKPKFKEWGVEPAGSGPFTVGPTWRDGGQAQYLVMANFEDPDYNHAVRQQMAKPVVMPLTVAGRRGRVAYDLLAQREIPLTAASGGDISLTLDMRRMQGALVALLPERIGKLSVQHAASADASAVRLTASLTGESGKPLDAIFPARITLYGGATPRTFYRVLGRDLAFELDLPHTATARMHRIEVREAISGRSVAFEIQGAAATAPSIEIVAAQEPSVPRPAEVRKFVKGLKTVAIVPSQAIPGATEVAHNLQQRLKASGVEARIADEKSVYHLPMGDPKAEDPLGDGYHSWHSGQEVIAPAVVVDEPVILLAGRRSSFLLDALTEHGYLSVAPIGSPGQRVRPGLQVAAKGLNYAHDTLCVIGNDAAGLQRAVDRLLGELPDSPTVASQKFGEGRAIEGATVSPAAPATGALGTNEMVMDLQFDRSGNAYAITWGHGKNLYSLAPDGKPRFSRHLPEMGANRLSVYDDRLYAYTAAGARVYRLTLDNRPINQARLNIDPGWTFADDVFDLSHADFDYLPKVKLLVHNHGDRIRLLDDEFHIVHEWQGESFQDKDVSDEVLHRTLHGYAVSPDGSRIAQLESSWYFTKNGYMDVEVRDTHLVIRDLTGRLLHEYRNVDNGKEVVARILWPTNTPGPVVHVKDERWVFGADLKVIARSPFKGVMFDLGDEHSLVRDDRTLVYHDRFEHPVCRIGPFEIMPSFAALSADGRHLAVLDEYGLLSLFQTADGKPRWRVPLGERGKVLRFTPDSQRLVLGGFRGGVAAYDLDGKVVWQTTLGDQNDILGQPLPLHDPAFTDYTERLWPVSRDEPGELEKLVRMDVNRLANGDCETTGGWQGAVAFATEGYRSAHSLKVGPSMVGQEVTGFLDKHVTWVLEFHYRAADVQSRPELLAGLMSQSDYPDSVARRFVADGDWRFARLVIKNGANCKAVRCGFSASRGDVLVDQVQLRRIRFPSINHMQFEPFHSVKPLMLENQLFATRYNPFGPLKEQAPNRVMLPNTPTGSLPQVDACYLQNGRLNDVTSNWYIQPPNRSEELVVSMGLKEPRWVSMVVLYSNAYDSANVVPHVDVIANDLDTKRDRVVARVRHNGQIMRIIKFAPVRTSLVKLRLVHSIARLRTITELEMYGPLAGAEGTAGFGDPDGQNTWMGDFTRVDKRPRPLPEYFQAPQATPQTYAEERIWHAPLAQPLVANDRLLVARSFGQNTAHPLAKPADELYRTRACGLGFTPYGTLYGGLLLRCGNDGLLYCMHPDSGSVLWTAQLGERLFGCPVVIQEDVFIANATGKLFQVDLASGGILKETTIPGAVFGSLATDGTSLFFITDNGLLNCRRATDLSQVWTLPVASFTDSTPAVDGGVVYLADQKGSAIAVNVADGKVRWKTELGDEFSRCPVVGPDKIIYGCRGGTLAVLNRVDGKPIWSRKIDSRFEYEPLLLDKGILYFQGNRAMLADLATGTEKPFEVRVKAPGQPPPTEGRPFTLSNDPMVPLTYYKGNLIAIDRSGDNSHTILYVNHPWHMGGGGFTLLAPALPDPPKPAEKKP